MSAGAITAIHPPEAWPGPRSYCRAGGVDWYAIAAALRDGMVVSITNGSPRIWTNIHGALQSSCGFRRGQIQTTERDGVLYIRMRPEGPEESS